MLYNILPPIIGAVTGYFTNWLAIKMLFLPYEPKYIGKFKIPFTPGIIPKERRRISKKISSVTEEKILNTETIQETLFSSENREKFYNLLEKNFQNLKEKNLTIENIFEILFKEKKETMIFKFENLILEEFNKFIFNEKYQDSLSKLIYTKLNENLNKQFINNLFEEILSKMVDNSDFKNIVMSKTLVELINCDNISSIKISIFDSIPKICMYLTNLLQENETIDLKLKEFTKNIINENVGTIASLFLNTDKIYYSIKENFIKYINTPENQTEIGLKVYKIISEYENKTITEIYENLPTPIKYKLNDIFSKKNILKNINNIENSFSDDIQNYIQANTEKYVNNLIKNTVSQKLYEFITNFFKNNRDKFLKFNINLILNKIKIDFFKNSIYNIMDKFIVEKGSKFISSISIADMMEDKINSFEMKTIEDIIVSVAKKELNAITIIGGVLGFIIGLVPVIINNI